MNRCPDCNKFVSLEQQAEIDTDPEIDTDGTITASVRLFMVCADCGTEMSEAILDIEIDCDEAAAHKVESEGEHDLSIEVEGEPEPNDRYETRDSKGKTIPYRFQRHFYSASVTTTVTCSCGESWEVGLDTGEIQASGMEDLI